MDDERLRIGGDDAFEELLLRSLGSAGAPAPFTVDVRAAVMARIEAAGPVPSSRVTVRELCAWGAAAAAVGTVIVSGIAAHAPTAGQVATGLTRTTTESAIEAARLGSTAATIAGALGRTALALGGALEAMLAPLAHLQPVTAVAVTISVAGMLALSTYVIARDFRAGASSPSSKETS